MGTNVTAGLSDMLREYAPHSVIMDEFKRDNFVFNQFGTDKSWKNGAAYQIPWELSSSNDTQMGALVDESVMGEVGNYKKAILTNQPEMWGAIKFLEKDLTRYSDLKQSFLKIFPDKLTQLADHMKANLATMVLRGGSICTATANGTVGGVLTVDRPQFLTVGQRVLIKATASVTAYVRQIDMNTRQVLFYNARSGGAVVDLSAYTTALGTKVMVPGGDTETLTSLQTYLLPAAQGGLDTIHGQAKLSSPLLQPQIFSGSAYTKANILDQLYDFYWAVKELSKVKSSEVWVPFHVFAACSKLAQSSKRFVDGGKKSGYGFASMTLIGSEGEFTLTAIADMPTDKIYLLNKDAFKFVGDTFFEKKRQLNSDDEFFTLRKTTGYEYIMDVCFRAEFVCTKLAGSAVVRSVPFPLV